MINKKIISTIIAVILITMMVFVFVPSVTSTDNIQTSFGDMRLEVGTVDSEGNREQFEPLGLMDFQFFKDGVEVYEVYFILYVEATGAGYDECEIEIDQTNDPKVSAFLKGGPHTYGHEYFHITDNSITIPLNQETVLKEGTVILEDLFYDSHDPGSYSLYVFSLQTVIPNFRYRGLKNGNPDPWSDWESVSFTIESQDLVWEVPQQEIFISGHGVNLEGDFEYTDICSPRMNALLPNGNWHGWHFYHDHSACGNTPKLTYPYEVYSGERVLFEYYVKPAYYGDMLYADVIVDGPGIGDELTIGDGLYYTSWSSIKEDGVETSSNGGPYNDGWYNVGVSTNNGAMDDGGYWQVQFNFYYGEEPTPPDDPEFYIQLVGYTPQVARGGNAYVDFMLVDNTHTWAQASSTWYHGIDEFGDPDTVFDWDFFNDATTNTILTTTYDVPLYYGYSSLSVLLEATNPSSMEDEKSVLILVYYAMSIIPSFRLYDESSTTQTYSYNGNYLGR